MEVREPRGSPYRRAGEAQPSPATTLSTVISPHVRHLRRMVGHDLLLLPSTAVLPRDDAGRLLLVRLVDTGNWATIGGAFGAALLDGLPGGGLSRFLFFVLAIRVMAPTCLVAPLGDSTRWE